MTSAFQWSEMFSNAPPTLDLRSTEWSPTSVLRLDIGTSKPGLQNKAADLIDETAMDQVFFS